MLNVYGSALFNSVIELIHVHRRRIGTGQKNESEKKRPQHGLKKECTYRYVHASRTVITNLFISKRLYLFSWWGMVWKWLILLFFLKCFASNALIEFFF